MMPINIEKKELFGQAIPRTKSTPYHRQSQRRSAASNVEKQDTTQILSGIIDLKAANASMFQVLYNLLSDPGKVRGCFTNTVVNNSLSQSATHPFPPTALRRRNAKIVRDVSFSHK